MIAGWTTAPFFSNFSPSTWSSRPTVATVYCIPILATLHPLLLSSHVIQSLPAIYTKHFDSHPIILGIVSILANLVQSRQHCWYVSSLEEGRLLAKSIKVFHLIKTAIPIYGYDEILRRQYHQHREGHVPELFSHPKVTLRIMSRFHPVRRAARPSSSPSSTVASPASPPWSSLSRRSASSAHGNVALSTRSHSQTTP